MIISLPSSIGTSSESVKSSISSFNVTQLQCSRGLGSRLLGSLSMGVDKELAFWAI